MLEELRKLKDLQKIDSLIFSREDELDSLPEENDLLRDKIDGMQSKVNELKNGISIQEEEKSKRSEILHKGEDKLKSITGKQSAIRNKDEYNTLLREIDNIKRFNKELDEEINQINREIEIKNEELKTIEEECSKKTTEYEKKIKENLSRISQLETEIDAIYEDRDKVASKIKPIVLRKYERILQSSASGRAIALAEDYICKGCNMTLPPQLFNNILKADKIEMCPNCQCILLPPDNVPGKEAE